MDISKNWLSEKCACSEGIVWFLSQKETDGVKVVKKLIEEKKLDWANWTIYHIFNDEQRRKYAVYAAEQIAYLWKDKYPKEYKIWKKWVDTGCPENLRAAAGVAAWAARVAAWAVGDAARAAGVAAWAARAAARAAASADAVAYAADAYAADAVAYAADAADAVAYAAARDAMKRKILNYGIKLLGI